MSSDEPESECKKGRDFNPKTCRYIQSCKPGYSRNKDFKCVRDATNPTSRSLRKEKLNTLKELFSGTPNQNGLIDSPRKSRGKPRILKKSTKKSFSTIPLPGSLAYLKQSIHEFVEGIGPSITDLTFGQAKEIAKSKGFEMTSRKEKNILKDSIVDYLASIKPRVHFQNEKSISKKSKSKKSFTSTNVNNLTRPPSPNATPPNVISPNVIIPNATPPNVISPNVISPNATPPNATQQSSNVLETSQKPKKSQKSQKPKKSFVSDNATRLIPNVRPKVKSIKRKPKLRKDQKEQLIHLFLNKIGLSIKHIPRERIKELAQNDGILIDSDEYRSTFNRLLQEYIDSYDDMTLKYALNIMNLNDAYTMDELTTKYKEKSLEIFPDKTLDEKKDTIEFKRLENAFNVLKERLKNNNFQHKSIDIPSEDEIMNMDKMSLFSEDIVFLFYSKSIDAKPGKGSGEMIPSGQSDKFDALSKIKDWRKKLSNFWIQPFELDGKRWQSVEHYYQGSKFKRTPDFYHQFSLDSGSDISKDPALAKGAGGKSGKFDGKLVRPKEIRVDDGFFEQNRNKIEMYKAQHAKFTQHDDLMKLLKLTKDAKLMHYVRGSPNIAFYNLMYIRSKI
jgi:predicted NAD-dependent protein-ADP-ribosyltransferase YbiA (DUF1768 family)